MKSCIHQFTDGGLGVSVSNNDVKICLCEIVLITSAGIDFLQFHFWLRYLHCWMSKLNWEHEDESMWVISSQENNTAFYPLHCIHQNTLKISSPTIMMCSKFTSILVKVTKKTKNVQEKKYFESINLFIKNHFDVGEKYLEYLKSACDNSMCCCKAFVGLAHKTLKFQNHIQIMMLQDFTISMFLRHQTIKVTSRELLMIISLESG